MCFDKSVTTFLNNYLRLSHMLLMLELLIEIKIYDFYHACKLDFSKVLHRIPKHVVVKSNCISDIIPKSKYP